MVREDRRGGVKSTRRRRLLLRRRYLIRAVHMHVNRGEKGVLGGMRVDPADDDEVFGKDYVQYMLRARVTSKQCVWRQKTTSARAGLCAGLEPLRRKPRSSH